MNRRTEKVSGRYKYNYYKSNSYKCHYYKSNNYIYSGSENLDEVGWYRENSKKITHPVGQKKPNELGIYDMSGNVWEWCNDCYDKNYYKACFEMGLVENPIAPKKNGFRVCRGGSWNEDFGYCRSASRLSRSPAHQNWCFGFRLAASPSQ